MLIGIRKKKDPIPSVLESGSLTSGGRRSFSPAMKVATPQCKNTPLQSQNSISVILLCFINRPITDALEHKHLITVHSNVLIHAYMIYMIKK